MKSFAIALWVLVCLAVPVSGLILFGGMASATGAPQEAVVICLALAVSIIPYIFARAITEIAKLENLDKVAAPPQPKPPPERPPVKPPENEPPYNYKKQESTAFLDHGR